MPERRTWADTTADRLLMDAAIVRTIRAADAVIARARRWCTNGAITEEARDRVVREVERQIVAKGL